MSSIVYEANARVRDPVYGCVGAISYLQTQVTELQMQLAMAQAEIFCIQMQPEQAHMPAVQHAHAHAHAHAAAVGDDGKSFLLHDAFPEYLNFGSSSNGSVIHDSLKRESLFGHDMVS